jgi:AcrR family transcriptional regulator
VTAWVATPDPATLPDGQRVRRARIVQAAIDLLEQSEYDAVQMRDVAREANVALATVYRYFTSKEHLYAATLYEWAEGFPTHGADRATVGVTDEARLRTLMRRTVRAFERHPQMMRAQLVVELSSDPNARAIFEQFAQRQTQVLTAALSGMNAETAAAVVETIQVVLGGRLRLWALGRSSLREVDRSVQRTIDLIFGDIGTA